VLGLPPKRFKYLKLILILLPNILQATSDPGTVRNNFCQMAVKTCFFPKKKNAKFKKFRSENDFTPNDAHAHFFVPAGDSWGKNHFRKIVRSVFEQILIFFGRGVAWRYFHQRDFLFGWWGKVHFSPQNIYCRSSVGGGGGCIELGSVGIAAPLLESG